MLFCEDYCVNKKILSVEFLYLSKECNEIRSTNFFSIDLIIMFMLLGVPILMEFS